MTVWTVLPLGHSSRPLALEAEELLRGEQLAYVSVQTASARIAEKHPVPEPVEFELLEDLSKAVDEAEEDLKYGRLRRAEATLGEIKGLIKSLGVTLNQKRRDTALRACLLTVRLASTKGDQERGIEACLREIPDFHHGDFYRLPELNDDVVAAYTRRFKYLSKDGPRRAIHVSVEGSKRCNVYVQGIFMKTTEDGTAKVPIVAPGSYLVRLDECEEGPAAGARSHVVEVWDRAAKLNVDPSWDASLKDISGVPLLDGPPFPDEHLGSFAARYGQSVGATDVLVLDGSDARSLRVVRISSADGALVSESRARPLSAALAAVLHNEPARSVPVDLALATPLLDPGSIGETLPPPTEHVADDTAGGDTHWLHTAGPVTLGAVGLAGVGLGLFAKLGDPCFGEKADPVTGAGCEANPPAITGYLTAGTVSVCAAAVWYWVAHRRNKSRGPGLALHAGGVRW